jgi:hypothetical protein
MLQRIAANLSVEASHDIMDQNYRATIPPQPTSRASYKHAARQISKPAQVRAREYFAKSVDPVLNDFLNSVASNRPDDVLAFMFAFSRKRLAERQLGASLDVDVADVSNGGADENFAASKIQARHRGRNDRERVERMKLEKKKKKKKQTAKAATATEAEFQQLPVAIAQPPAEVLPEVVPKKKTGAKAKKMGSLLMKAKQDGSLDVRVDDMEKALGGSE